MYHFYEKCVKNKIAMYCVSFNLGLGRFQAVVAMARVDKEVYNAYQLVKGGGLFSTVVGVHQYYTTNQYFSYPT